MQEIQCTLELDSIAVDLINQELAGPSNPIEKDGNLLHCLSADLGDGYEVDIKIVNGNQESGPYVDAVLFHLGCELECLEPARFERVDSEFIFEADDKRFVLKVKGV